MPDVFFCDDSRQDHPSREGMGPLVAAGFVHVPSDEVRDLEKALGDLCVEYGFPTGPAGEFKWSPGRELWMRDNLIEGDRSGFFERALRLASEAGAVVAVAVEDKQRRPATGAPDHAMDVTALMLERIEWRLRRSGTTGMVVVDRPSGDRGDEDKFLQGCLETVSEGTDYVRPERIAVNVVSTPSRLVRTLQLADVVTSCTTALVAGEERFAPTTFEHIRPMLDNESGRIGGVGLKVHPHLRYVNLYGSLVQDEYYLYGNTGLPLPDQRFPYAGDPMKERG